MTSPSATPLARFIDSVSPMVSMERDGLVIIALDSAAQDSPSYLTFAEAAAANTIDVHELGGGSVPAVEVETQDVPVVIFGGDTIVGGKQNRIVNVTIWLTEGSRTQIPVTCLEHGRWDPGAEARFSAGPKADISMRRMVSRQVHLQARAMAGVGAGPAPARYAADQGAVWDEVELKHRRARTTSQTAALHDLYAEEAPDVSAFERAFPYPEGACGAAIAIGGRLVTVELYDRASTARTLWPRLIEGAVRGHLDHQRMVAAGIVPKPNHRYPDRHALMRFLDRTIKAQHDAVSSPAVGEGTDLRFETDRIVGSALLRDEQVVHLEVHRVA